MKYNFFFLYNVFVVWLLPGDISSISGSEDSIDSDDEEKEEDDMTAGVYVLINMHLNY